MNEVKEEIIIESKVLSKRKIAKKYFWRTKNSWILITFGILFVTYVYSILGKFFLFPPSDSLDNKYTMLYYTWQSNSIVLIYFFFRSVGIWFPNNKFFNFTKSLHVEAAITGMFALTVLIPTFIFIPAILAGQWNDSSLTLLNSNLSKGQEAASWIELILLHFINPPLVVIPFFLRKRKNTNFSYWWVGSWAMYPIFYIVFTMLWGLKTSWYPYPIIDPNNLPVMAYVYIGIIAVIFFIVSFVTIWFLRNQEKFKYFKTL